MDTLTIDRPSGSREAADAVGRGRGQDLNLALQGGGAHGAFFVTRLIDEGRSATGRSSG